MSAIDNMTPVGAVTIENLETGEVTVEPTYDARPWLIREFFRMAREAETEEERSRLIGQVLVLIRQEARS